MTEVLRVENLQARYGRAQALWDINLSIGEGDGLGLIGHNGAGKSTLLRCIAGAHRAGTTGRVMYRETDIRGESSFKIARRGLSFVREGAPVFGDMTVIENLMLGMALARRRDTSPRPLSIAWETFPILETMTSRRAGLLSGGQRQMLATATALLSNPSLLLLDEPSAGLAPEAAENCFAAITRLREAGLSLLIAEQSAEWLVRVTTRSIEIESGRMLERADPIPPGRSRSN